MLRKIFILTVFLIAFQLVFNISASAATVVSGIISSSTNWTQAGSPYRVVSSVTVSPGVTLTIEPGVVVKFLENTELSVKGTLNAQGTPDNQIYFTDYRDDSVGGDTNGDGTATNPDAGWWRGIVISNNGTAAIDYCVVQYGGASGYGNLYKTGAGSLTLTNSNLSNSSSNGLTLGATTNAQMVSNNTITSNGQYGVFLNFCNTTVTLSSNVISQSGINGIHISNSSPLVQGNTISSNTSCGIYLTGASTSPNIYNNKIYSNDTGVFCENSANPVIGGSIAGGNDIFSNTNYGVQNTSSMLTVNAQCNWWGSSSGPYHSATNDSGTGDNISDNIDYADYLPCSISEPGRLQFSTAAYSVNENCGSATVTVTRTHGCYGTVDVTCTTSNGTAAAESDYTTTTEILTFDNGVINQTFSIPITDDTLYEGDETVHLSLSDPTGGATLDALNTAVLTIVDNDPAQPGQIQFSAPTYTASENDGGIIIIVSRTDGSDGVVTVLYSTANGTATAGSDYTITNGTLTFGNGVTSQTFNVPIVEDTLFESNETVLLSLSNPTGGVTIGNPNIAVLTITDNDPSPTNPGNYPAQPGWIQFSAATYTVAESENSASITVTRSGGSDGMVTALYSTANGTATVGLDYTAVSGTLTFSNGVTSQTFSFPIMDDTLFEGDETVLLSLSNPTGGATIGATNTAVLTILDNEQAGNPPRICNSDPADGATSVAIDKIINITFSENIQKGDNLSGVILRNDKQVVNFTCSVNSNVLTICPAGALDYNSTYVVCIPAGAVKSAAGNTPVEGYAFAFSTEAAPDNTPPQPILNPPKPQVISKTPSGSGIFSVFVPAGAVNDAAGNVLAEDYIFTFTTE